jgi:competence transcription factor ComK
MFQEYIKGFRQTEQRRCKMQTEVENTLELRLALKKYMPQIYLKKQQKQMGLRAYARVVTKARGFIPADTQNC